LVFLNEKASNNILKFKFLYPSERKGRAREG